MAKSNSKANVKAGKSGSATRTPEEITCLSVQQPYVDEIFFGSKWCENRSWKTNFRGELWIHSSKVDREEVQLIKDEEGFDCEKESPTGLATGYIFGSVELVTCVPADVLFSVASDEACLAMNVELTDRPKFDPTNEEAVRLKSLLANLDPGSWRHFRISKFAWIFAQPEMLQEPIKVGGKLQLWKHQTLTERLELANRRKKKWVLE